MSLQARITGAIAIVLLVILVLGTMVSYWHAQRKVEIEMHAAMTVARNTVERTIAELPQSFRPQEDLISTVQIFNGDRHVQATLITADGRILAESEVPEPAQQVPDWFNSLIAPEFVTERVDLPSLPMPIGAVLLRPDPRSEVDEVWADVIVNLSVLSTFFVTSLAILSLVVRRSLAPIASLTRAFERIGRGESHVSVAVEGTPELAGLCQGCNDMATRLDQMAARTQQLSAQLISLQEEERADLARDLHDEVGPFLFAIDVDAGAIDRAAKAGWSEAGLDQIRTRAAAIRTAAAHARTHVRGILGQLRPGLLGSLGLSDAVRDIVHFYRDHEVGATFVLDIDEASFGPDIDPVILGVIREATTNAVRHSGAGKIEISIRNQRDAVAFEVRDDGRGFDADTRVKGFGLIGMRERVINAGGEIRIGGRSDGAGTVISARIPVPDPKRAAAALEMEAT